jgi:transcription elongation factor GreB
MARVVAACGAPKTLVHDPTTLRAMRDRRIGASMIQIVTADRLLSLWMIHSDPPRQRRRTLPADNCSLNRQNCVVSKAFTSEETPDDPIVVPPRAPLPAGVPNYVTARGLELLRTELATLEHERAVLTAATEDTDRSRKLALNAARAAALGERIASAQPVDPRRQSHDEVRFGATVTLLREDGTTARWTIVGVDEADPAHGRIAFLAPLARAVTGLRVGDIGTLRTANGEEALEIVAIDYDGDPPRSK